MRKGKTSGAILLIIIALVAFGSRGGNKSTDTSTTTRNLTTAETTAMPKTITENATVSPTTAPTEIPSPTPEPTVVPMLQSGNKGDDVVSLQELLITYGYLSSQPTGKYDNATTKAVKDFQINNGLKENGKCDQAFWDKISSRYVVYQTTVYKSKSGKVYHSYDTCSGMKTAKEMTLSDALRKGLTPCSHCH